MNGSSGSLRILPSRQAVVAVAGLVAISAREVGSEATAVVVAVGAAAALMPQDLPQTRSHPLHWMSVLFLGVIAFGTVRYLTSTPLPSFSAQAAVAGTVAAVAEEAFFRRFLYGWLSQWGAAIAVVGSAVAFAAVHTPLYGPAALPIDLAAGLLFGWQRWATGSWTAPATTHIVANLLILR